MHITVSNNKFARSEIADFWDAAIARWLSGGDGLNPPLDRWFSSYNGKGKGAVNLDHYPDPYIGDLRGARNEPRLVFLGLNPGIGFDALQSRYGVWARRVAKETYSRCFRRSPAEDPESWLQLRGKPSRYWDNLIRFSKRWLDSEEAGVSDILNFELFPWHSNQRDGTGNSDIVLSGFCA